MLEGHGIEPNIDDATFWFEKARNLGEAKATFTLGLIKEKGIGTRVNKSKAQELFRKAAEMNDPSA
jgi:TPR repeat protein